MNEPYPVAFDVERPPKFQRAHVFLRIAVLVVIGWIAHPLGLLWVGLPVVAAVLVSRKGGRRYVEEDGATVVRGLGWLVELAAYLTLLTDRLPGEAGRSATFRVERSGSPTLSSALWRVLYVIPNLIVLAVLTFVGAVVWVIALFFVLASETYPAGMWRFLLGLVRWEACVLAYLASLVDRYPPFVLQTASVSPVVAS